MFVHDGSDIAIERYSRGRHRKACQQEPKRLNGTAEMAIHNGHEAAARTAPRFFRDCDLTAMIQTLLHEPTGLA